MTEQEIHVGMADLKVAKAPAILSSLGIGSCVGIALYFAVLKIGGLSHIMLPDSNLVQNNSNRAKFANTAIPDMIDKMEKMGANRKLIRAKIMGGAHMFNFPATNKVFNVGERNVAKVKEVLQQLHIRLIAEDTGGDHGRSMYFNTETGDVTVRTIAHGERII
ncbi:MAG: chemotaxis protein CheD [Candidatus Omnitrophota bacterium]